MARREVYVCDRCGRSDLPDPVTLTVAVGVEPDAIDGKPHPVRRRADLCGGCASALAQSLADRMTQEEAAAWCRTRLDALTPAEVAGLFGVSVTTVRAMVGRAGLPCYRLPACGHRRFRRAALVRWLEENGMPEEMVARARGGAGWP